MRHAIGNVQCFTKIGMKTGLKISCLFVKKTECHCRSTKEIPLLSLYCSYCSDMGSRKFAGPYWTEAVFADRSGAKDSFLTATVAVTRDCRLLPLLH